MNAPDPVPPLDNILQALRRAQLTIIDQAAEDDDRIRAALAILYELDRRAQYAVAFHALNAQPLPEGQEFSEALQSQENPASPSQLFPSQLPSA